MAKQKNERIGLAKALENVSHRNNLSQVFNDFLMMVVCAFSLERMEPRYMEIAKRYDKEEMLRFADTLGEMVLEYEHVGFDYGWDDIIGKLFEEVNSSSQASNMGQFFTPKTICDLMARINDYGDGESIIDPTCGSGRNLIAHCRLKPGNRYKYFYTGSDLDERCVNMSVINFVMFGMKGVIIHMNALSLEIYKGYRVYLPETGLGVMPLTKEQCKEYLFSQKEEKKIQVPEIILPEIIKSYINQQLTLF